MHIFKHTIEKVTDLQVKKDEMKLKIRKHKTFNK